MRTSRSALAGLSLAVVLSWAGAASATLQNQKSFKEAYPGKEAKAYSCKICHNAAIGKKGDFNAYGAALQQLKGEGKAKALTVDDYRKIEKGDADKDGVSNLDEWKAGTDMADPKSKPAGTKPTSRLPKRSGRLFGALDEFVMPSAWAEGVKEAKAAKEVNAATDTKPVAEYVGMETCASCHTKQYEEFKHSTHARIAIPGENVKAQGCETCHGPGSLHVEAGGGRGVGGIINPRKDPSTCFACHLDKKAEFRLPYHHPVMEGKMNCVDCHSPHGEDVRPWSSTSMKDVNEVCFRCHKEQRGPFVWEHEALREGCTTCHKVHGSINEKMLIARDANLCLRCHTQVAFPTIGKSSHSGRLYQGTCFSAGCHTAVHGSNFSDHLRY